MENKFEDSLRLSKEKEIQSFELDSQAVEEDDLFLLEKNEEPGEEESFDFAKEEPVLRELFVSEIEKKANNNDYRNFLLSKGFAGGSEQVIIYNVGQASDLLQEIMNKVKHQDSSVQKSLMKKLRLEVRKQNDIFALVNSLRETLNEREADKAGLAEDSLAEQEAPVDKKERIQDVIKERMYQYFKRKENLARADFERAYENIKISQEQFRAVGVDLEDGELGHDELRKIDCLLKHYAQIDQALERLALVHSAGADIEPEDAYDYYEQIKTFSVYPEKMEAIVEFIRAEGSQEEQAISLRRLLGGIDLQNERCDASQAGQINFVFETKKGEIVFWNDGGEIMVSVQKSGLFGRSAEPLTLDSLNQALSHLGLEEATKQENEKILQDEMPEGPSLMQKHKLSDPKDLALDLKAA